MALYRDFPEARFRPNRRSRQRSRRGRDLWCGQVGPLAELRVVDDGNEVGSQ